MMERTYSIEGVLKVNGKLIRLGQVTKAGNIEEAFSKFKLSEKEEMALVHVEVEVKK